MKLDFKLQPILATMAVAMLFGTATNAQSRCCGGEAHDGAVCTTEHQNDAKPSCGTSATANDATSGCLPSRCYGAKTKFDEAKGISKLRSNPVALETQTLIRTGRQ